MQSSLRCFFFPLLDLREGEKKPKESKIALTKKWRFHMPSIRHLVLMIKEKGSYQKSIKAFQGKIKKERSELYIQSRKY